MIDKGIKAYRKALVKADHKQCMADTMPGRWLTATFIEPIAMKIRGHIHRAKRGEAGPMAKDVTVFQCLDHDACAFIAIRTIMNSIITSKGRCEMALVQGRIRKELVEELQYEHMETETRHTTTG